MAFEQNRIPRSTGSWISSLAVPRKLTLPVLLLIGLCTSQLVWLYVDSVKVVAWLSGLASPFCILCATAVWAMRDKVELAFNNDATNSIDYLRARQIEDDLRSRSTVLAGQTAFAALIAASPMISNQLIGPIWQFMILGCGSAVAFAIYAYLISSYWDVQIRAQRTKEFFEQKRATEQNELLEVVKNSVKTTQSSATGWTYGPELEVRTKNH